MRAAPPQPSRSTSTSSTGPSVPPGYQPYKRTADSKAYNDSGKYRYI